MNINYKESQIDFLSHVSGKADEPARPRYMAAQISLSLENLVIFAIVAIMVVIFSFSIGIERGKGVALSASAATVVESKDVSVSTGQEKVSGKTDVRDAKAVAVVAKAKTVVVPVLKIVKADKSTAVPTGAYTLQIASYKGLKSAQREADKLKQKGFDNVYVLPKGAYTVVCVGNFQNKEDASGIKRQLNNRYQGSVVRRL